MEYGILIPVLPLLAFVLIIFFGKRLPGKGSYIGIFAMALSFILSCLIFVKFVGGASSYEFNYPWFSFGGKVISAGILIDGLTAVMLVVVTLVSLLVQIYSIGYMHNDIRYSRYYSYLSLFTFSMLGLILSNSFFEVFMCWELVGVCSYLLIGFWFEKKEASDAGKKAFITTKIGDLGFTIGIFLLFVAFGTLNFNELKISIVGANETLLTIIAILIFCGAIGKSAQFPLHVWLPDAMEGPTPVSALIHAATMVAAGVYLVARSYFIFAGSEVALSVVAYIGIITAFLAATMALVAIDIKRVLAFSTISQLGFMMFGLGVGGYTAGMFHLTTHAFFKALLFLGAGSVIHSVHTNDIRKMGGLGKYMKITAGCFFIASLSISGIWPFSGFYSKDEILVEAFKSGHYFIYIVATIVAFMTAFYMFRLCFLTFTGEHRDKETHPHESPNSMTIPLIVLAILSVVTGKLLVSGNTIEHLIHFGEVGHPELVSGSHASFVPAVSLVVAILGIVLAWLMYYKKVIDPEKIAEKFKPIYTLLLNKYYFDEIYDKFLIQPVIKLTKVLFKFDFTVIDGAVNGSAWITVFISKAKNLFDIHIVDGAVNAIAWLTQKFGNILRHIQTGLVQNYMLIIIIGLSILVVLKLI
ncbi:MAG: NADH-quinone oxidoreductase subunit L [Candidatus Firestonebacteria bacterium]